MPIIKLDATDSTNSYLKRISAEQPLEDYTIIQANTQSKGRGQMGTSWQSESGKNLTVSVFKDVSFLKFEEQYFISIVTALAVAETLKKLKTPNIKIKWPNDILSETFKISGILIENVVKNNELKSAIVGVGINVNQRFFDDLPKASSVLLQSGKVYNVDEVLDVFIKELMHFFQRLMNKELGALKSEYEEQLFRIHKPSTFMVEDGQHLTGYINGINHQGHLEVLTEDAIIRTYDMKEIRLLY
ncbi:biotin--[acetyl-CoA-carboxylase] ligase [Winogradskyella aurantiaca]|uniref:biotin--[acetyl-CoA-carboxylase] ligase n=1 Tax=Winogradskyella aurantiaca TaxID=2219558 RepID=UPI000E1D2627|nr:biotin--[acetyl-CoA-carboxylase] ligase [Winogradskyella aurantiaca]